jgi:protein-disulfide isomerase
MDRRQYLTGAAGFWIAAMFGPGALAQGANPISREKVLRDPDIPVTGNPQGDITIVEYFDYQCPYCKTIAPVLADIAKQDGGIRIVLKDWPIFGELSVQAARLVLAAKFQNKFHDAHDALMASKERLTEARLIETLKQAGVDMERLRATLDANDDAIKAILVRNEAQAKAFGFQGTPSFIVGTFRVPGVPTAEQFKLMIADVRAGKDKTTR